VDAGSFSRYLSVQKKAVAHGGKVLLLTLRRSPDFPSEESSLESLLEDSKESLSARLTAEALARGYVRCELFDKHDKFLGYSMLRITGLRKQETVRQAMPLPRDVQPARLVLTY
jgi:hypothetical protein